MPRLTLWDYFLLTACGLGGLFGHLSHFGII